MVKSVREGNDGSIKMEVLFNGTAAKDDAVILYIGVTKSIYKISKASILLTDGDMPKGKWDQMDSSTYDIGSEVEIKIGYGKVANTVFKGMVISKRIKVTSTAGSVLVIECADKAIKMTGQKKFGYNKEKKDSELMSQMISGTSGVTADVETTPFIHKMIVQHNMTDWDFLLTRAQANEMIVWTDNNKVIVKKANLGGSPDHSVTYGTDVSDIDLTLDGSFLVKSIKTQAWDPSTQNVVANTVSSMTEASCGNQSLSKVVNAMGYEDSEIHSTGNMAQDELEAWAKSEFFMAGMSKITGKIKFDGALIDPNQVLEINNFSDNFKGNGYITGVYHEVSFGQWTTEVELGLEPDFFAKQRQDITLSNANGLTPAVHGLFIGKVKKIEADPDGEFRVQVYFPIVEGKEGEGVWARMSHQMASGDFGSYFYPEIDDEVICGALGGDMRFPIILGVLHSSVNASPISLEDANNHKGWITREKMELNFDEEKKIITIKTPNQNMVTLSDDEKKIELEDEHGNRITMDSDGITISSHKNITIEANMGNFDMTATQNISAKTDLGNFSAEALSSTVKGTTSATVEGQASLTLKSSGISQLNGSLVKIN